jgi:hypothetical protein
MKQTAPLTTSERQYIIRRLEADGLGDEAWRDPYYESSGIPIIIVDREILDLYGKADKRAADMLADYSGGIHLPIASLPPEFRMTGTDSNPTWRRINRGEIWTWITVGFVAGLLTTIATALGIFFTAINAGAIA